MISFALGIIVGVLLTISWLIFLIYKRSKIEQHIERIETYGLKRTEAEIFEPTTEAQDAITEVLSENEKKGRDTKLEEIT